MGTKVAIRYSLTLMVGFRQPVQLRLTDSGLAHPFADFDSICCRVPH
ncbi:hypothetical protein [Leptolyngbya sp. FACHB-261]|nr:hypothetical protein [Leptolyngbya sp. FACHB-261]MBD2105198.1 hypothetical protein [Leptolyngbya sp. FACHB-261]